MGEKRMRLNLGCGDQKYSDFVGVDIEGYAADIIHDLRDPLPFPDNSVDEILASHVIEHFSLWEIDRILNDWNRVLKPYTGVAWGFVPDIRAVAEEYIKAVDAGDWFLRRQWISNFNGGYASDPYIGKGEVHMACYDESLLREKLTTAHFSPIEIIRQHPSPTDYRLFFVCGKGIYPDADTPLKFQVPWATWREEGGLAGMTSQEPEEQKDG